MFVFGTGASARVYIGSADMMTRNTEKRVEVACPVYDENIRRRLLHGLKVMLSDNVKARQMDSTGAYRKKKQDAALVNAQETFMKEALNARRPAAVSGKRKTDTLLGRVLGIFRRK